MERKMKTGKTSRKKDFILYAIPCWNISIRESPCLCCSVDRVFASPRYPQNSVLAVVGSQNRAGAVLCGQRAKCIHALRRTQAGPVERGAATAPILLNVAHRTVPID